MPVIRRRPQDFKSKVAIYGRETALVAEEETQYNLLRDYAVRRNWFVEGIYLDRIDEASQEYPKLDQMVEKIMDGKVDIVLVFSLDRLGHSVHHLIELLELFKNQKVDFISFSDRGFDTTQAHGELIYTIMSAFAKFEKKLLSQRTKEGLQLARLKGKKLGRRERSLTKEEVKIIRQMKKEGKGVRPIAKAIGIAIDTLRKRMKKDNVL